MTPHNLKETKSTGNLFLIVLSCYLALVSLIFGAGIGQSIDIYGKTIFALLLFSIFYFMINIKKLYIPASWVFVFFIIIMQCIICNLQFGKTYFDYLRIFLIFIPFATFTIYKSMLTVISLFYGVFGLAILLVANFTPLFSGWDGNSISLNAFFSYVVFIVAFCETRKPKILWFLTVYSIIYYLLLIKFNSRSTILFSIFLFLSVLSIIPLRRNLNKTWLVIILILPLIIAVFIVMIKDNSFIVRLNSWSYNNTNKPIFNGRDELWENGFKQWLRYPIFGTGNINYTAHNSAITCLVGGGAVGYCVFVFSIYKLLKKGLFWFNDTTVFGLVAAFLTIWLQQSVELGLMASAVNPIPYMILALLYSRIKTLEKNDAQIKCDNSCL